MKTLAELPQDQQRTAALRMFADGQIGRRDLDTVLKILDSGQALQLMFLTQQNKYLEQLLDERDARRAKVIEQQKQGDDDPLFPRIVPSAPAPVATQ